MLCLNNADGPLCYYETNDINEEGKIILFECDGEVREFILLATMMGVNPDFFKDSLIVNAEDFSITCEGIYWKDIPTNKLFTRPEVE